MLLYLLKVMACHGCFWIIYHVFLRNSSHYKFSRFFLLVTLITPFFIPILESNVRHITPEVLQYEQEFLIPVEARLLETVTLPQASFTAFSLSLSQIIVLIYGIVSLLLLARYLKNIIHLFKLQKVENHVENSKTKLFITKNPVPFSFFFSVFIPKNWLEKKGFEQLLAHECAHARLLHSMDRILIDFIIALYWFNPFIYLYRQALIAVHEFQADQSVLRSFPDKLAYQQLIVNHLSDTRMLLASQFNVSIIKQRITMMNNSKSNIKSRVNVLLTLPFLLLVVFAFSARNVSEPISHLLHVDWGPKTVKAYLPIIEFKFQVVKPSIFPIDKKSKHRISSAFGMRQDPAKNQQQHHNGIDIAAPTGTEVYATADGTVRLAESKTKGFGVNVIIDHNVEPSYATQYAHMDSFVVKKNDVVKKGDLIGYVGSSGWSTAPHLHYSVFKDGKPVNPATYITDYDIK